MSTEHNNHQVIEGLQTMIQWLESRPQLPSFEANVRVWVYEKERLLYFARYMGSFTKLMDDNFITLTKKFNEHVSFSVVVDRTMVCKKVVTWECPEEGLLALASKITQDSSQIVEEATPVEDDGVPF